MDDEVTAALERVVTAIRIHNQVIGEYKELTDERLRVQHELDAAYAELRSADDALREMLGLQGITGLATASTEPLATGTYQYSPIPSEFAQ